MVARHTDTMTRPTLHLMCGKMAAGKTTLARRLASEHQAVLIAEDLWLQRLFGQEIETFEDYRKYAARLKTVVGPHVQDLLRAGLSVVMDFPANIPATRLWLRSLFEAASAEHVLHFVDTPNTRCLEQLARRNRELPEGSKRMTEAEFEAITALFVPPAPDEGFNIRLYR